MGADASSPSGYYNLAVLMHFRILVFAASFFKSVMHTDQFVVVLYSGPLIYGDAEGKL